MSTPPAIFVRIDDAVRGPFTCEQLRTLGEVGTITPKTEASAHAAGPWSKLQDRPNCAEIFPPHRKFQFKAREFENVNQPPEMQAADRRPPGTPPPLPPSAAISALEIVQENMRAQAQCEPPVDLRPPPNRRRRDYLVVMAVVNGFFVASLILGRGDETVTVFGFSGMVMASAAITWVMYGVMSRY